MRDETRELEDKIRAAFSDPISSDDLSSLLTEVGEGIVLAAQRAARSRNAALDPRLLTSELEQARTDMEAAEFAVYRLGAAKDELQRRLDQVKAKEEDRRRSAEYERVMRERDELAQQLAAIYPAIERDLPPLLARIAKNNREVEFINGQLPTAAKSLLNAELVARKLDGFVENAISVPGLTENVRLPRFARHVHDPFAWPQTK